MDTYFGELRLFSGNYAPRGWRFCDGQILNIQDYQPLFTVIGNMYGGDGNTNFALPNLMGMVPVHQGQGTGLSNWNIAQKKGQNEVVLNQSNLPSHTHDINAVSSAGNSSDPTGMIFAARGKNDNGFTSQTPDSQMNPIVVGVAGGTANHHTLPVSLMQPYLSLGYIICVDGPLYPSKP